MRVYANLSFSQIYLAHPSLSLFLSAGVLHLPLPVPRIEQVSQGLHYLPGNEYNGWLLRCANICRSFREIAARLAESARDCSRSLAGPFIDAHGILRRNFEARLIDPRIGARGRAIDALSRSGHVPAGQSVFLFESRINNTLGRLSRWRMPWIRTRRVAAFSRWPRFKLDRPKRRKTRDDRSSEENGLCN